VRRLSELGRVIPIAKAAVVRQVKCDYCQSRDRLRL